VQGTDCLYKAKSGHGAVQFRIYFDSSPAQATDLHARLKMFYGTPTATPSVGDEAYIDSKHALHERKGNVRFYIEFIGIDMPAPARDKQLVNLATGIGGRL
jgi:hypothetical protein